MFSSSLDSTEVPVRLGSAGCVGWSGVRGSEGSDGDGGSLGLVFLGKVADTGLVGGLFRLADESIDIACDAPLASFDRCFASWIAISERSDLKVARKSGASLLRTVSILTLPSLSFCTSTEASCRDPAATPTGQR